MSATFSMCMPKSRHERTWNMESSPHKLNAKRKHFSLSHTPLYTIAPWTKNVQYCRLQVVLHNGHKDPSRRHKRDRIAALPFSWFPIHQGVILSSEFTESFLFLRQWLSLISFQNLRRVRIPKACCDGPHCFSENFEMGLQWWVHLLHLIGICSAIDFVPLPRSPSNCC